MVEPLRHRQPKGAATDMFYLQPPRHISTLPDSEVSECPLHVGFSNRPIEVKRFQTIPGTVSMSLAGSRFSSESALRPFHHGVRRRGGTIYWAALPSDEQPISANNEHPDQSGSCSSSAMCVCSYAATRFIALANGLSPSQVCIERLRSEVPVSLRRPACTSARTVVNPIQIAVMVRKSPTI